MIDLKMIPQINWYHNIIWMLKILKNIYNTVEKK